MFFFLFATAFAVFPGYIKKDEQNYLEIRKPGFIGRIPQLGFGTYNLEGDDCNRLVSQAIELGYRHIDTADGYKNHKDIARALKDSEVKRDDMFITSKINYNDYGTERTRLAIDRILSELELEYIDMIMLQFPGVKYDEEQGHDVGGVLDVGIGYVMADVEASLKLRIEAWRALEAALENRKVRFIGVANYEVSHLKELLRYAKFPPSVNQVELHPFLPKMELQEFCKENKIIVEVYGSIVQNGMKDFLKDKIVGDMAEVHDKSEAQVALRWAVQQDLVVLPKSTKVARIKENMDIFDWELRMSDRAVLMFFDCEGSLKRTDKVMKSCRKTPCGKACYTGTHYWDPSLVPASNLKSTIDRLSKEVDMSLAGEDSGDIKSLAGEDSDGLKSSAGEGLGDQSEGKHDEL